MSFSKLSSRKRSDLSDVNWWERAGSAFAYFVFPNKKFDLSVQ